MTTRLLLTAAVTFLLAACGGSANGPVVDGDGGATDPAGSWTLVDADPPIEVPDDARVTLDVVAEGEGWQVGGTAACNSYGGTVVTDGAAWRGDGYGQTDMGCDEPRMAVERAYLDTLTAIDAWARPSTDELVLSGPGGNLHFELLPPVATAQVTRTTWVLEGLTEGGGPAATVSSTVAGADEATLRLGSDGTVDASTGCRTFVGEWTESGDEVLLTTFRQRDDSPNVAADGTPTCEDGAVAQEDHVLSVLGDGFRAEVAGQQLTLTSRDGLGLVYRAEDA